MSHDPDHALKGWFVVRRLGNQFEISISTRYEDRKANAKGRKWCALGVVMSHSRSLKIAPFDRLRMTSYQPSILSCLVRCTASEVWSKIADFNLPTCGWIPVVCSLTWLIFHLDLCRRRTQLILAATLWWFMAGGAIRIALRQLLQNRKLRHLWRHNLGSRRKLQNMARENFSIGALYNIAKNQHNPIKTVGRDSFFEPQNP